MQFGTLEARFRRTIIVVSILFFMGDTATLIGLQPGYTALGTLATVAPMVLRALQGPAAGRTGHADSCRIRQPKGNAI